MDAVVIEHTFVTTQPEEKAVAQVAEVLARFGFTPAWPHEVSFPEPLSSAAAFVRTGKKQFLSTNLLSPEQRVYLAFDRGRVTVALALENLSADLGRGKSFFAGTNAERVRNVQTAWLMGLADMIESRARYGLDDSTAEQQMASAAAVAQQIVRRRTRWAIAIAAIVIGVVALLFLMGYMADRSARQRRVQRGDGHWISLLDGEFRGYCPDPWPLKSASSACPT